MGFSREVAQAGLEAEFASWTPDAVHRASAAADRVNTLVISARTLPVSALRQVLLARLGGGRVLLKPARGQAAAAEAIAAADHGVEVQDFSSDDALGFRRAAEQVDRIVVLGADDTIAEVKSSAPPHTEVIGFGHRVSAAWVREPTSSELQGLAQDICAWDQAGCMSPQVVWVEGDPASLVEPLATALRRAEGGLPMALPVDAARARSVAKTRAEMLGVVEVTETAVVAAMPSSDFVLSPGYRFIWLLPADEVSRTRLHTSLSTIGTNTPLSLPTSIRECPLGEMQRPPLDWVNR